MRQVSTRGQSSWVLAAAAALGLAVWRMLRWLAVVLLLLIRGPAAVLAMPLAVMLILIALIFGFWAETPHFVEQRWTMLGVAVTLIAIVRVLDWMLRALQHEEHADERDYR